MKKYFSKLETLKKQRFVKFGLPFLLLVLGGSFYLEQFTKLRFQFGKQANYIDPAELRKLGIQMKDYGEVTLESEYEKLKKIDIDNWQQVRIPRPWDENASE